MMLAAGCSDWERLSQRAHAAAGGDKGAGAGEGESSSEMHHRDIRGASDVGGSSSRCGGGGLASADEQATQSQTPQQ